MRWIMLTAGALWFTAPGLLSARQMEHPRPVMDAPTESTRMVMATDDVKVFRLIRPVVAALQVRLAELGMYEGPINGLYGPSTSGAVTEYQDAAGQPATGLPTLSTGLGMLSLDAAATLAAYGDRIDIDAEMPMEMHGGMEVMTGAPGHAPEAAGGGAPMRGMDHGAPRPAESTDVSGDPAASKTLMIMRMPNMMMEDRHTSAVRAARAVVAALQIKLAESGAYTGIIDGLPESPAMVQAVAAFQGGAGVERTGSLDFPTALALFGLDAERVATRYAGRLAITTSPVAIDRDLMRTSAQRFSGRRDAEPAASEAREMHNMGGDAGDTVRVEVTLREFSFTPDTIRIPAGQPVTLVIRNAGAIPHEFMAGHGVEENGFERDIFAGVHVSMTMAGMESEEEEGGHAEEEERGHAEEGRGTEAEEGEPGADHHGTMITAAVGQTVYMSFTLPESRRGVWTTGCFLPGHAQAGMLGTLVVE